MGQVIDLTKEFKLQTMKNRARLLSKDVGGDEYRIKVITKENSKSDVGYDVYLFDIVANKELLIDPVKLENYFSARA